MTLREAIEHEQLELLRAQRVAALWSLPILGNRDIPAALDISASSWERLKSTGGGPALFTIEGRVFVLTSALRAWVEAQGAQHGRPGVQRQRRGSGPYTLQAPARGDPQ